MSYTYQLNSHYQVKKNGNYPWPCTPEPKRTIELFTDDILSKQPDGTFVKHTGLCCANILLKSSQVKKINKKALLQVI